MASSATTLLDNIKEQELDILEELGEYDLENEPTFRRNFRVARLKAKQQLALSDDSPFAHPKNVIGESTNITESQRQQVREERAALLSKETSQIRDQLDFVKLRLQEIRSGQYESHEVPESSNIQTKSGEAPSIRPSVVASRRRSITKEATNARPPETKYRPLTGKTDCPNCACDTRKKSICDLCLKLNSTFGGGQKAAKQRETTTKCFVDYTSEYDNRPIRPAKERTLARVEVSAPQIDRTKNDTVEDVVVPGRVYTISKNLNDKRTKLAQAIDELQRMMEQVKAKSNRLEEERKLVQLYKDQWKYGPSIGGPKSSSRERLGLNQDNRNYESRLDANLSRDSKSVMGFKHIEPSLKLRQYNKPPVAPRRSLAKKAQPTVKKSSAPSVTIRSKSLESLKQVQKARVPPHVVINENFQNGKASSEINLRKINEDEEEEDEGEVEEKIEEGMDVAEDVNETSHAEDTTRRQDSASPPESTGEKIPEKVDELELNDGKVTRMAWIPVFGETEIKTVKKPATRKVQIMKPSQQRGNNSTITRTQAAPMSRSQKTSNIVGNNNNKRITISAPSNSNQLPRNDRVLNEASRKLRFASDLLEQERSDSRSKNQLLVSRQSPTVHASREAANKSTHEDTSLSLIKRTNHQTLQQETSMKSSVELSESNRNELARIEEMVNEQQKLLNRLAQLQERQQQVASPVTVTCSSPCCMMHRHGTNVHGAACETAHKMPRGRMPIGRSLLVSTLKDRLNKGKLQLARTLEQEREKHQQLKQKVDSSLRKQSDLQHENELLKQSLGKCIDTCLRDISSTFESLSDTLTNSVVGIDHNTVNDQSIGGDQLDDRIVAGSSNEDLALEGSQFSALSHAAQFISDSKHMKQLKAHIETIEQQRTNIFEELKREKQKSTQLETKLQESLSELSHFGEIKRKLEGQLKSIEVKNPPEVLSGPPPGCSKNSVEPNGQYQKESTEGKEQISRSSISQVDQKDMSHVVTETLDQQSSFDFDDSQSSIELYRKYIESMSPDIESIRRERKMILNEFDSIKKMLSVMDQ